MKSTSIFGSLLAAISAMAPGWAQTSAPSFAAPKASHSRLTAQRRSRFAGNPGKPGNKLARMAAEGRLTTSTIR